MSNGLKRATAYARMTRVSPGMGMWLEEYKCGCTSVTRTRKEALGYCPTHGEDLRRIIRLPEPVGVGLTK